MISAPRSAPAAEPLSRRSRLAPMILVVALLPAGSAAALPGSEASDRTAAMTSESMLSVTVRDVAGRPAEGALVTAEATAGGGRVSLRSDAAGSVSFAGLPDGVHLVYARSRELSASALEVTVRDGAAPPLDLTLRFGAVREDVVVSAALAARRENDSGTFVDSLSAASLEERGEWSLLEGLRGVPGALIRQDGGPGRQAYLQIRGLPASSTAVVVDGAPLRDTVAPQGSAVSLLSSLVGVGVDRVEIRRGGGSSLYGTSGIGGVLQIVTRSDGAADGFRVSGGAGTLGHQEVRGDWGTGFGPGGSQGGVALSAGHLGVTEGPDGDDPFTNRTGFARVGFRPRSSLQVTARGLLSSSSVGLNESPIPFPDPGGEVVEAIPAASSVLAAYEGGTPFESLESGGSTFLASQNDPDSEQRADFRSLLLSVEGTAPRGFAWSARFHDLWTRREYEDGPAGPSPWDPASLSTTDYSGGVRAVALRGRLTREAFRLTLGGEAERERAETTDPVFEADLGQSSVSGFAQGELFAGPSSVRGALRVQRFETREARLHPAEGSPWLETPPPVGAGAVTGDLSAAIRVAEGLRLRGSWGRGFRAPSLYERFGTFFSSFGYSVYGDPTLDPEFGSTFDAGLSAASRDGRIELRAAYFSSQRPQVIRFGALDGAADPYGRWLGYENAEAGNARGIESGLAVALPGRVRARFHWTWTDADPPENAPDELESDWVIPRHQGGALLSGTLADRVLWSADLHLTSTMDAPLFDPTSFESRVFRFPGMRRLDLAAGLDLGAGLRLRAIVEDAFDDAAFTSGGFQPAGRVMRAQIEWRR